MAIIDTPITASASTLEKVLNNPLPKLLVFYHKQLPTDLEQGMKTLAHQSAPDLLVVKLDTTDDPGLNSRYNLTGSGTAIIGLKDGKEVARTEQPTPTLLENYAAYLLGKTDRLETPPAPSKSNGNAKNTAGSSTKPVTVSESSFQQEVLQSDQPVLVDFWAAWCGPCRTIAPSLERLANEFAGQVKIAKLNVDENQATMMRYGIQGIPALLMFKGGKVIDRVVGAAPENHLREFIKRHI